MKKNSRLDHLGAVHLTNSCYSSVSHWFRHASKMVAYSWYLCVPVMLIALLSSSPLQGMEDAVLVAGIERIAERNTNAHERAMKEAFQAAKLWSLVKEAQARGTGGRNYLQSLGRDLGGIVFGAWRSREGSVKNEHNYLEEFIASSANRSADEKKLAGALFLEAFRRNGVNLDSAIVQHLFLEEPQAELPATAEAPAAGRYAAGISRGGDISGAFPTVKHDSNDPLGLQRADKPAFSSGSTAAPVAASAPAPSAGAPASVPAPRIGVRANGSNSSQQWGAESRERGTAGSAVSKEMQEQAARIHDELGDLKLLAEWPVIGMGLLRAKGLSTKIASAVQRDDVQSILTAVAKLAGIVSVVTMALKYTGARKYFEKKIEQWFDRPTVYKLQHGKGAKRRFWQRAPEYGDDLLGIDDLVYPTRIKRILHERVNLINRVADRINSGDPSIANYVYPQMLFYGPPGTGKTSAIRAIAKETGWSIIELTPEHLKQIRRESDRQLVLKEIFERAKAAGKVIIAFDEIETMSQARAAGATSNAFLTQLLSELNALKEPSEKAKNPHARNVIFVAATNNIRGIDPALLDRFTIRIEIGSPDIHSLKYILDKKIEKYVTKRGFASEVHTTQMAKLLAGSSGRNIDDVVRLAVDKLLYEKTSLLTDELFMSAMEDKGLVNRKDDEIISSSTFYDDGRDSVDRVDDAADGA